MKYQRARPVSDIIVYEPGKPVEELEREFGIPNSIKAASNENPLGPSPKALEAMRDAVPELHRYPDGGGFYLKNALAEHHGLMPGNFVLGNGTNEVLEILAHAYLDPGDPVVFSEGAFIVYHIVSQLACCEIRRVPMRDYHQNLDAMADVVCDKTKIVFLANPNNPTGTGMGEGKIRGFLNKIPPSTLVVVDEAYCQYAHLDDYPDSPAMLAEFPNLIVMRTFSKAYGLAGLRVGYGVADEEVAEAMERVREPFNVNALALVAAQAALGDVGHVERSVAENAEGREYFVYEFSGMGLPFVPTQGNFIMVEVGDGAKVYQDLLREGVIVRPVAGYGFPRHVRISIGTRAENETIVRALSKVLNI